MADQKVLKHPGAEPGSVYGYIIVAAASCIMLVSFGTRMAFGVFFKPMLADFGWSRAVTSGAFSLSMVMEGFSGVFMGGLNDRLGPRVVLTISGILLGLGYLLMSRISTVWELYLFYGVVIGIGMSGTIVPLSSTVARWFVARRSVMTGIVMAGSSIGAMVTPPVANWLIYSYDWRTSYIILGSVALAAIVLAAQFLRRNQTWIGQLPNGRIEGGEQRLEPGTEGFTVREAVGTGRFWLILAMFPCFAYCVGTTQVHIVPHATDLGISPATAAGIMTAVGGAAIIGNVVLGGAGDRIGNRQAFMIGLILILASMLWLLPATEAWEFYLFAVMLGLATGGCIVSEPPLVAGLFGLRAHGLIFGITGFTHTAGAAIGPLISGRLFDATGTYETAFMVCIAVAVVGLILMALLIFTTKKGG